MRKTLIAGSALAIAALCGLSLIATRQETNDLRIPSGPQVIDASSLAKMKHKVPSSKGMMKVEGEDSPNVEKVTFNMWSSVDCVYDLSNSTQNSVDSSLQFSNEGQHLYTGTVQKDGELYYGWLAEGNVPYAFSGTLSGMQPDTVQVCLIYLNNNTWYIGSSEEVVLNEENNYSSSFAPVEQAFADGTKLGVAFICNGDGSQVITASGMSLTYEAEAAKTSAWNQESDLPGLGLNVYDYPDSVKYVASLADGVSKLGVAIYDDQCIITGVNTTADTVEIPNLLSIKGTVYTPTFFGYYYSDFDWTGATTLKTLKLGPVSNWYADAKGSVLTDIWSENTNLSINGNYNFEEIYLHMPFGTQRYNYSFYGFKRVLVGVETPDFPESQYSNWIIPGEREGDYFGITDNGEYYIVCEVFTDSTSVTLPEATPANGGYYYIRGFGYDNNYSNILCANAPNLKSVTVPQNYTNLNINWSRSPITELHMQGSRPETYWTVPQSMTVYVGERSNYSDYENTSSWNSATLLPEGWEFEWMTVNVARRGEFAQTYIEMTDANWEEGIYVKVTGTLNEIDLGNIKNLTQLRKLDLSEAIFDNLPDNFLQSKGTLTDVILPASLKTISNSAFNYCQKLMNVIAPGVTRIYNSAFRNCGKLVNFNIEKITRIDDYAFEDCESFNPTLPSDLTYLGTSTFENSGITEAILPAGMSKLNPSVFRNCRNLVKVVIPGKVQSIKSSVFSYCPKISEIIIPEGVTEIGSSAFSNCTSLATISLPSTLNTIGYDTFNGCSSLMSVVCKAIVPPVASSDFTYGMDMNHCTLYVAPFAIQSYRDAQNWNAFYILKALNDPIKNLYINRPMTFDLLAEDNAVLQDNPNMVLTYGSSSNEIGQLTAQGDGTLSAGTFDIYHNFVRRNGYSSYNDYRTTLINNAENMRADSVSCRISFEKNYWHFISFQYDVQMSDIFGLNNTDFVIRKYNGQTRATGDGSVSNWEPVAPDDVLEAGRGYIIQAANNTTNESGNSHLAVVVFPSRNTTTKNNLFASGNIVVPLEEYQAEFAHNRSWNLVGNPYPSYYDIHFLEDSFMTPIVLWKGSGYQAYSPVDDDIILRPNEAFFVQRPLDAEQMVFGNGGRLHFTEATSSDRNGSEHTPGVYAAPAKVNADRSVFNFNVKGATAENRARIVINENASMAYETGCDAPKFFAEESTDVEVYVNGDIRYDICERPLGDASALLGVKIAKRGEYTVSLSGRAYEGWNVMLTDKVTGTTVDLAATAYSFDSEAGDFADRFAITFKAPTQTSVSEIEAAEGNAPVRIVNLSGVTVYEGPIADFNASNGVYVVLGAQKAYKVILK